jgi:hypothetical protein
VRIWNGSVRDFDYVIHETLAELWFYGTQERMQSGSPVTNALPQQQQQWWLHCK